MSQSRNRRSKLPDAIWPISTKSTIGFSGPSTLPWRLPSAISASWMAEDSPRYCDVALPVPVDRLFTYELPLTLRHRARPGSRVWAPFGARKLTGVLLGLHNTAPEQQAREVLKLLDEEPVLDADLLRLARWIAEYYCAPIGEVLKGMLPLGGELRRSKLYTLTSLGRDVARQLTVSSERDNASTILALLEERSR